GAGGAGRDGELAVDDVGSRMPVAHDHDAPHPLVYPPPYLELDVPLVRIRSGRFAPLDSGADVAAVTQVGEDGVTVGFEARGRVGGALLREQKGENLLLRLAFDARDGPLVT